VYERAAVCCAFSSWAAASAVRDYGIPDSRVRVVAGGRNVEAPAGGRDWSRPRLLFVGRGWENKNGERVLRAFARLREDVPDARLDVVGDHPPIAQAGVVAHGLLRRSRPPEAERLGSLFAAATCFVMPSHCEPFGIAYVEAAAAGVPSIATEVGGARDILGDDGGRIVDPRDDGALLGAMRELADPDVAAAAGDAAARRAERLTWPAVARRIATALEEARR
jgi:glycosyltransferase involved in cell wall biosynthesis